MALIYHSIRVLMIPLATLKIFYLYMKWKFLKLAVLFIVLENFPHCWALLVDIPLILFKFIVLFVYERSYQCCAQEISARVFSALRCSFLKFIPRAVAQLEDSFAFSLSVEVSLQFGLTCAILPAGEPGCSTHMPRTFAACYTAFYN